MDAAAAMPIEPNRPGGKAISTGPPRLTPLRELQLVEAHRMGDPDAMGELLQAYQRRIYGVCFRMMHDHDLARDLAQDSMVKLIEGLDTYDGRSKLSTWVIRVTMNCCLSYLRKKKLRTHASLDEPAAGAGPDGGTMAGNIGSGGGSGAIAGATREPGALERIEHAETHAHLLRALASLDAETRALLVLRDMQDLDYEQIAAVLDVPLGTVKSRLFRARAAMRSAMEGKS